MVALEDVQKLLGDTSPKRDLLLEYLHAVQDKYGCLDVQHLVALAEIMKIPQAEVYEVASFYAYFDIVSETESAPPEITVRICDSLTCAMFGAQKLLKQAEGKLNSTVRVQRAPCMGRCDQAPVAAVGSSHVRGATMDLLELHVSGSKGLPEVTVGRSSQGLSKYLDDLKEPHYKVKNGLHFHRLLNFQVHPYQIMLPENLFFVKKENCKHLEYRRL